MKKKIIFSMAMIFGFVSVANAVTVADGYTFKNLKKSLNNIGKIEDVFLGNENTLSIMSYYECDSNKGVEGECNAWKMDFNGNYKKAYDYYGYGSYGDGDNRYLELKGNKVKACNYVMISDGYYNSHYEEKCTTVKDLYADELIGRDGVYIYKYKGNYGILNNEGKIIVEASKNYVMPDENISIYEYGDGLTGTYYYLPLLFDKKSDKYIIAGTNSKSEHLSKKILKKYGKSDFDYFHIEYSYDGTLKNEGKTKYNIYSVKGYDDNYNCYKTYFTKDKELSSRKYACDTQIVEYGNKLYIEETKNVYKEEEQKSYRYGNLYELDGTKLYKDNKYNITHDEEYMVLYDYTTKNVEVKKGTKRIVKYNPWKDTSYSDKYQYYDSSIRDGNILLKFRDNNYYFTAALIAPTKTVKASTLKYKIQFDANGGKGSMSKVTAYFDINTKLPKNEFTKKGYKFAGWNTKKDGSGVIFSNKEDVANLAKPGKTATLYAQWGKEYKLLLNPNGGNLKTTEVKRVTNGKYGELPIPTKKGYYLEGWNTKKDGSGKNITSDMKIKLSKDQKLFAQWIENEYNVIFDANGGFGYMEGMYGLKYTKSYKLKANEFEREGYKFVGWNTKKNGSGTSYSEKESIKKLSSELYGSKRLYAQWEKID